MKVRYIFKRTNQLSRIEKNQYLKLKSTISPTTMTAMQFDKRYSQTPFGYSYHSFMMDDDSIVGAYNTVPYSYNYFGKRVMFCLSVDAMIHPEYRKNPFGLLKTANLVVDAMKQDGICFIFGFPNAKVYEYTRKVLKWRDIGELDIYMLPRNISGVFPKLTWLNMMSRAFANTVAHLPSWRRQDVHDFNIEKTTNDIFRKCRYDSSHRTIEFDRDSEVVYKILTKESGVKVLYVIDVHPLNAATFDRAIRHVYKKSGKNADLIIFTGKLPFKSNNIIRLPSSLQRRYASRAYLCGKILDNQTIDDRIFDMCNWNINLSNSDVP